ncbi:VanW family protein [Ornithinibacillus salinisoli]
MKKVLLLTTICLLITTSEVAATTLVIKDEHVSETLVREHFRIQTAAPQFINRNKLELLFDRIEEQIFKAPKNAYINDHGQIIPAKPGVALNRYRLYQHFHDYYYSNVSLQVDVPLRNIYPRVDGELLSEIRNFELGSYMTYFRQGNKERSHNIELAAEAINNHVVFPGEQFSFNNVVGKRTKERGYKRAPVIVKGELSEDIGGGICQVSSTLFNAVSLDGIKIVERYSHSRKVPYVPPGKDATVSWWGPDFVFVNEYNHPILIRAKALDGKVIIRIFSSESVEIKSKRN